ncbi:MAG: hypothetical protein M3N28_05510 [Actinomycetota bacterium]|nr:hypothetical protein [Actinomycetota bacterium]
MTKVASFELTAARPQRFLVGLLRADNERLVGFGTVQLDFAFTGTKEGPLPSPRPGPSTPARFLPIAGSAADPSEPGPRFVEASTATGVYSADPVTFSNPGFWEVRVTARVDQRDYRAEGRFEVLAKSEVPAVGDPAPRTANPLAAQAGVSPRSIDSRADAATPVPDPELHSTTVAQALDARRPLMVVVSTPTFCQSRFCGPITDAVSALARRYGDRMAFVHLEVWRDYEKRELNPSAQEWIDADRDGDGSEPWTFVVDSDGLVKHRFDNVASDGELEAAVRQVLGL